MSRHVSDALANRVCERAGYRCEYCLIGIADTYFGGEIDHIRSLKHGGLTEFDNLALACQPCNRYKGTDLGSISSGTEQFVFFFNPRTDVWYEHFALSEHAEIRSLTPSGEVTVRVLKFNESARVLERRGLIELGNYFV